MQFVASLVSCAWYGPRGQALQRQYEDTIEQVSASTLYRGGEPKNIFSSPSDAQPSAWIVDGAVQITRAPDAHLRPQALVHWGRLHKSFRVMTWVGGITAVVSAWKASGFFNKWIAGKAGMKKPLLIWTVALLASGLFARFCHVRAKQVAEERWKWRDPTQLVRQLRRNANNRLFPYIYKYQNFARSAFHRLEIKDLWLKSLDKWQEKYKNLCKASPEEKVNFVKDFVANYPLTRSQIEFALGRKSEENASFYDHIESFQLAFTKLIGDFIRDLKSVDQQTSAEVAVVNNRLARRMASGTIGLPSALHRSPTGNSLVDLRQIQNQKVQDRYERRDKAILGFFFRVGNEVISPLSHMGSDGSSTEDPNINAGIMGLFPDLPKLSAAQSLPPGLGWDRGRRGDSSLRFASR